MNPIPPRTEAEEEERRRQEAEEEERRRQAELAARQREAEERKWVAIANFASEPEASAAANQLKAGGISVRCPDVETIGGAFLAGIRALFRVQVDAQDVEAARAILAEGGKWAEGRRQGSHHYWVFGVDAPSQQPRDPVFLEADNVQQAWDQATREGLQVTGIEVASPAEIAEGCRPEDSSGKRRRRRQYEFNENQNLVIGTLAFLLRVLAVAALLSAAVLLVLGLLSATGAWPRGNRVDGTLAPVGERLARGAAYLLEGGVAAFLGMLLFQAGGSFRKIVDTQGRDVSHLMAALGKLKQVYAIQVLVMVLGLLLLLMLAATGNP
jgi:hypothetical protein